MNLSIRNLRKSYGTTEVLRGVNLDLSGPEGVSIVGTSGSGKSTLLYVIGGLEKPESGEVIVGENSIIEMNDADLANFRNEHVGFVFQFHFLLPSMNCLDNILLPAKIGGYKISEIKKRVLVFADRLGVSHCLKKFPFEISGGEQQRINIIRAISLSPELLLCDEPTGNLDTKNTQIVLNLLKEVSREVGSKLIVVTHDRIIADSFGTKITIEDGQIIG